MSGILKPLILPDAAAIAGKAVSADQIESYEAFDRQISRPDLDEGSVTKYEIVFHLKGHLEGNAKKVSWEYADGTDRDAGLALVDNTVGAVVA